MRGFPSFLFLFSQQVNTFNDTRAQKLDSIYHMTSKVIINCIFGVKRQDFAIFTQRYNGRHYVTLRNL